MLVVPRVVDLSHYQYDPLGGQFDWDAIKADGIWGVIYKSTEGTTYVDDTYADARRQICEAGLFHGAYHFFRPGNVTDQVDHFIQNTLPDETTLLCLDHEDEDCNLDMVKEFLLDCELKTGQRPVLYSGHLIKEQIGSSYDAYLSSCRLWLAQYGSDPEWPPCWETMWLWQYTDGGNGPTPHEISGIGHCDINSYGLSRRDLARSWAPDARREPSFI